MRSRLGWSAVGGVPLLIGLLLPTGWYHALPRSPDLPPAPPLDGVLLLKLSLVVLGLILVGFALAGWRFHRVAGTDRLPDPSREETGDISARTGVWALLAITALAAVLRFYRLGTDLWLDEITPLLSYGHMSALEVIATYSRSNNHLLNTLLVKLSTGVFGEAEWAVRLPAALFGIATVPVLFWLARLASSRWVSLGAALLLATSYHHTFFSQNARGYSAYLFFTLLSTGLLIRGLTEDRPRLWLLYMLATVLNFASLLLSAFVFAAHVVVGAITLYAVRRRGGSPWKMGRRLAEVLGVSAFLGFLLYALVLPDIYMVIQKTYTSASTGFTPVSSEFLGELVRGVVVGFGPGLLLGAVPFLLIGALGFWTLLRRHPILVVALGLPLFLSAAVLLARGFTFSPRFFILALPLALTAAVQGVFTVSERLLAPRGQPRSMRAAIRFALPGVALIALASLASLRGYYSVPKQPYSASLRYVEAQRKGDGVVVVLYLAEKGYRYYGRQVGIREGRDYFFVRTQTAFDEVLASHRDRDVYLVTTFPRAFRMRLPELSARVRRDWVLARAFGATVGDGAIQVWKPRTP